MRKLARVGFGDGTGRGRQLELIRQSEEMKHSLKIIKRLLDSFFVSCFPLQKVLEKQESILLQKG